MRVSHPCGYSGLGLLASLTRGATSILGPLRRRAGGKTGSATSSSREDPCPRGAAHGGHVAPGPRTLGCSASRAHSAPTPSPPPGDSWPSWKLAGGGAEAGREVGVRSSPEPRQCAHPPGQGRRAPSPRAAAFLRLFAHGQWMFLRAGQGAEGGLGPGLKPTRWNPASHDPKVLPGTVWCSWWRHWSHGAGLQTHGHTMEPLREDGPAWPAVMASGPWH